MHPSHPVLATKSSRRAFAPLGRAGRRRALGVRARDGKAELPNWWAAAVLTCLLLKLQALGCGCVAQTVLSRGTLGGALMISVGFAMAVTLAVYVAGGISGKLAFAIHRFGKRTDGLLSYSCSWRFSPLLRSALSSFPRGSQGHHRVGSGPCQEPPPALAKKSSLQMCWSQQGVGTRLDPRLGKTSKTDQGQGSSGAHLIKAARGPQESPRCRERLCL